MSKRQWFIAKFDNHSEFETFEQGSDYGIPNVSLCKNEWSRYSNVIIGV